MLLLIVAGRSTFRNLSRYSGYVEKTFSRWFRRSLDWAKLNVMAIRAVVPADHESILAFDPSYMAKSGQHTEGLGYFWNSSVGRAQRGLEVNVLSWVDVTANTAYALSAEMTPPGESKGDSKTPVAKNTSRGRKKGKGKKDKGRTADGEASRVEAYLAHLKRIIQAYELADVRYLTADGFFSKVKFVDGVIDLNLHLISKLRCDADARYLYTGPYCGRGAPRRYAGKVDWNHRDPEVFIEVDSPSPDHRLETALVDLPRLRRTVRVVVVIEQRTQRRALLFSTDCSIDPVTLYRYYKARFQIEFLFRDSKQFAGLTHCQARRTEALTFQVNASLTAVSISKLQAFQTHGQRCVPLSMASLARRAFNAHFLKKVFAYLAPGQTLKEHTPEYETLCNYGVIQPISA